MRTKLMQKLNRNLTEEENSSQCLKILTQITIEDENELAERQKQLTSESFDNDNKLTLKSFFAFCRVFFYKDKRRKDGNNFQTDTVSSLQCPRFFPSIKNSVLNLQYAPKTRLISGIYTMLSKYGNCTRLLKIENKLKIGCFYK